MRAKVLVIKVLAKTSNMPPRVIGAKGFSDGASGFMIDAIEEAKAAGPTMEEMLAAE